MRAVGAISIVAVLWLIGGDARADGPPWKDRGVESKPKGDPWVTRPRTFALQGASPGGPMGLGGLTFEYAPIKYLVLGAGGGYAPEGPRLAFLPRLRLPLTPYFAVGFGVPFSGGPYKYVSSVPRICDGSGCGEGYKTTRTWDAAFWTHFEPNLEFRIGGATAMRIFGGYSRVLNPTDAQCESTMWKGCPSSVGEKAWYGGLTVGYAF
jgi:hypothetical protein